jgi:Ca2+-binding RTX toxin-like protein
MFKFWKREDGIERGLRALRSQPRREFEDGLVDRLIAAGSRSRSRSGVRVGALVALTAGMLGLLGAFGGFSYAASGGQQLSSAQAAYNKVLICHKGHEINVDENAVPAFISQGDLIGPCPAGGFLPPVVGSNGNDSLNAGNGSKKVNGGGGNDTIKGGNGDQRLSGGSGNDTITAGKKGHDVVYSGTGNDVIFAHNGHSDYVDGGKGHDVCHVDKALDIVKNCEVVLGS